MSSWEAYPISRPGQPNKETTRHPRKQITTVMSLAGGKGGGGNKGDGKGNGKGYGWKGGGKYGGKDGKYGG